MSIDLHQVLTAHQTTLLAGLDESRAVFENAEAKGTATEFDWITVIGTFLPARYRCTAAIIMDSNGNNSDAIDVVIHDRHYCPLLFEKGGKTYIPAESVYAILEVKQELDKKHVEYAADKAASVRRLHRTNIPFQHAGGIQIPRPLFSIIAGVLTTESSWSDPFGKSFDKAIGKTVGTDTQLDLGCSLRDGAFDIDWATGKPKVTRSEPAASLMFFLMRLFARLQGLGTVPAIDLAAYGRSLEV